MEYYVTFKDHEGDKVGVVEQLYSHALGSAEHFLNKGYTDIVITCEEMQVVRGCRPVATRLWNETYPERERTELNTRYWYGLGDIPKEQWEQMWNDMTKC